MLTNLKIKNIALIDQAEIDFRSGINILSGETGAGKSVILDSINFALGAKADKSMIRHGTEECSASAVFEISQNSKIHDVLREYDIEDDDGQLILTRRLSLDGRASARCNGSAVTLSMLKAITQCLVDVHGQSEHYSLLKNAEQLSVIDSFSAKVANIKGELAPLCHEFNDISTRLNELFGSEAERAIKLDVLKFQINEIEKAAVKENEEGELKEQCGKFRSYEKLNDAFNSACEQLERDGGAIDCVREASREVNSVSSLDGAYSDLYTRLDSAVIELSDIADTLRAELEGVGFSPAEAERAEERLEIIKKLNKKYGGSFDAMSAFLDSAREQFDTLDNYERLSAELTEKRSEIGVKLCALYRKLTDARKVGAEGFAKLVTAELTQLGMPSARFTVEFSREDFEPDSTHAPLGGLDSAEFMFSANLGEPVKPLSKIISGGEMSRFMLAVKTITAPLQDISTIIFDEIDTGISGITARVVAEKFAKIAVSRQIIAVSHLVQIASFADNSLLIYKCENDGKTTTHVVNLGEKERIDELCRLSGGLVGSDAAVVHAKELLASANAYKLGLK